MKQKEWMVTKDYWEKWGFPQKRILKVSLRSEDSQHVFDNLNINKKASKIKYTIKINLLIHQNNW